MNIQEAVNTVEGLKAEFERYNEAKDYVLAHNDALKRITKSKNVGISKGELKRYSRLLVKLPESDIDNILAELVFSGLVKTIVIPTQSGRGRTKVSYVAVEENNDQT